MDTRWFGARRAVPAALLLLTAALAAGGLAFRQLSTALFLGSSIAAVAAVVFALREGRPRVHRARSAAILAMILVAALVAGFLSALHWGTSSTLFESAVERGQHAPVGPTASAIAHQDEPRQVQSDDVLGGAQLNKVAEEATGVLEVTDIAEDHRISLAQEYRYEPESDLVMDWNSAVAQDIDGAETVTVPLIGSDLPLTSKVTFLATADGMTVVEMASGMLDDDHAALTVWQNGTQTTDLVVANSATTEGDDGVYSTGWSWNKFSRCLNNQGVNWAVITLISAACSLACVASAGFGCVACAVAVLGGASGTVSACAYVART